jgi:limonene-1,2-epoxide hydrolase
MTDTIGRIEAQVLRKYQLCEDLFRRGDMAAAAKELYTEDVHYLTGDLRLLRGIKELVAFLETIKAHISEVHVELFHTWGDPSSGLVYQLCNTSRRMASGEVAKAHYIATLREVDGDWLIEMEVPALGAIQPLVRR